VEPFELYPVQQAVAENRVVHVPNIVWMSEGRRFSGEAFFPGGWTADDDQPLLVAVRADGWSRGCLELQTNAHNAGAGVGRFKPQEAVSMGEIRTKASPRLWTHDELVIAMNLYCKLPFGQLHERNPVIIALATILDRTPGSLAMKLCNLASLDPVHAARGVKGLSSTSQADRNIWDEFHNDWDRLAFESERLLARINGRSLEHEVGIDELDLPREGLERERVVRQRVNQHFFRAAVLAAYNYRCCITGLSVPELLIASHVIPWAENKATRVNPANGLCLNAFHDRAFDRGLITLSDKLSVMVSPRLRSQAESPEIKTWLLDFDGVSVRPPERFLPELEFLAWHRRHRFQAAA
jgi:putative restriction endonuclease